MNRSFLHSTTLGIILLVGAAAGAQKALGPAYDLSWHTIDGGGGTSTGGTYSLSGTIGQHDASTSLMTGGTFELAGGFWAGGGEPFPPCLGDIEPDGGDQDVDIDDYTEVVLNWGGPGPQGDTDDDSDVDIDDFTNIVLEWGPCN